MHVFPVCLMCVKWGIVGKVSGWGMGGWGGMDGEGCFNVTQNEAPRQPACLYACHKEKCLFSLPLRRVRHAHYSMPEKCLQAVQVTPLKVQGTRNGPGL